MSNIGTKFSIAQRFIFDPNHDSIIDQSNNDEQTYLGSNESRILLMLSEHPNEVISRQQLHEFVWREQGFEVDDSSLTQAISTLRKVLNDSTKSPQFIKTIPKRGYQLIATIERLAMPLSLKSKIKQTELIGQTQEKNADQPLLSQNVLDTEIEPTCLTCANECQDQDISLRTTVQQPLNIEKMEIESPITFLSKYQKWFHYTLAFLALIMPLGVYYLTALPSPVFVPITSVDGITILTTLRPSEFLTIKTKWFSHIKKNIAEYKEINKDSALDKVIVSSNQNSNITLNYIHTPEQSFKNISIRLITSQLEKKTDQPQGENR